MSQIWYGTVSSWKEYEYNSKVRKKITAQYYFHKLKIYLYTISKVTYFYTCMFLKTLCVSCSVMSDSLQANGLLPTKLLCPSSSPGKNTRECCHFLLQGIFLTQGSNPGLRYCRQILYCLSQQGNPSLKPPNQKKNCLGPANRNLT